MAAASQHQVRAFYADLVTRSAGVADDRLRAAFATVPREQFLPPRPWQVYTRGGYVTTPSDDPVYLYQDTVVAILPERGLNNGQPSLHATCLTALAPQPGETAVHIGIGMGYYTALLTELVGPQGRVEAIEIDADLAKQSERRLAERANVTVHCRSGFTPPIPAADVIYVNAGVTAPSLAWLDALKPAGRLLFPLTPGEGGGGMLLVTHTSTGYAARFVSPVWIIPCVGGQDEGEAECLRLAYDDGHWREVRQLYRDGTVPDDTCWYYGDGWWLSTRELA